MIEMRDVTKVYEMGGSQVLALNKVSLTVEDSDLLAVMGPSGSGKSTLLYTVGGLLTPTTGDVLMNGVALYELPPRERSRFRRKNVGFIFQTFELLPYLTALENAMLPLYLAGASSPVQETTARDALTKVGLADRAFHKPTELSGGEQQRVAIARGIVNNPPLLLADEPTGNLDKKTGHDIMQLLCSVHETEEITVIVVTHDPAVAERADRVVELIDGRVVNNEN